MKRLWILPVVLLLLAGCTMENPEMEEALAFRSKILGAERVCFSAQITADYIDHTERFTLNCETDGAGVLSFEVAAPEEISGITGTVAAQTGALTFEDTVLAFPMMADDRLSPVSGPWVLMQALRAGYLSACVREGELLHLTVDDSYEADALTVEVWLRGEAIVAAEISWRGVRQMTIEVESCSVV